MLEAGTNRQNSYTDEQNNHFGPTNIFKSLILNHGHFFKERRQFYSSVSSVDVFVCLNKQLEHVKLF